MDGESQAIEGGERNTIPYRFRFFPLKGSGTYQIAAPAASLPRILYWSLCRAEGRGLPGGLEIVQAIKIIDGEKGGGEATRQE